LRDSARRSASLRWRLFGKDHLGGCARKLLSFRHVIVRDREAEMPNVERAARSDAVGADPGLPILHLEFGPQNAAHDAASDCLMEPTVTQRRRVRVTLWDEVCSAAEPARAAEMR
jgi:hypothetical protein